MIGNTSTDLIHHFRYMLAIHFNAELFFLFTSVYALFFHIRMLTAS